MTGYTLSYDKCADWLNAAKAFKCLYYNTDLLDGALARSNMDALLTPHIGHFALALMYLEENSHLLIGPYAQANFNLLVRHEEPEFLAEALSFVLQWIPVNAGEGLFDGKSGQANFEALLSIKELHKALPQLNEIFDFDNELDTTQAQRKFNVLVSLTEPVRLRMGLFPEPQPPLSVAEVLMPEMGVCATKR